MYRDPLDPAGKIKLPDISLILMGISPGGEGNLQGLATLQFDVASISPPRCGEKLACYLLPLYLVRARHSQSVLANSPLPHSLQMEVHRK